MERFADWLTTLTVEREDANGCGGGAGKAKIILCGHRYAFRGLKVIRTELNSGVIQYGRARRCRFSHRYGHFQT